MRILLVHSGYKFSTGEVGLAIGRALKDMGHYVSEYQTEISLNMAKQWLGTRHLFKNIPITDDELTELTSGFITNYCVAESIQAILVIHGGYINPAHVAVCNKLGITTSLWLLDDPHEFDLNIKRAEYYKVKFVNNMSTIEEYGDRSFYVPTAVDIDIFKPGKVNSDLATHVLMYGSFYPERVNFVKSILELHPKYSLKCVGRGRGVKPEELPNVEWHWEVHNWETIVPHIQSCKIVVDVVRDNEKSAYGETNKKGIPNKAINPRVYETLACRKLILTDTDPEALERAYGSDAVDDIYYDSTERCNELIEFYLKDNKAYNRVVNKLYKKTIEEHTYNNRAHFISCTLGQFIHSSKLTRQQVVNRATQNALTSLWNENYEGNKLLAKKYGSIQEYEGAFKDKTGIIISNAPGLSNTLEKDSEKINLIGLLNNGAVSVAVNGAYKELCEHKILPNFLMVIDPKEDQDKYFRDVILDNDNKVDNDTILLLSYLTSPNIIKKWKGGIKFFSTATASGRYETHNGLIRLLPGFTVLFSALQFLLYGECKNIVFLGADLAYTNNKKYFKQPLDIEDVKKKHKDYIIDIDVNGNPTITNPVMIETRNLLLNEAKKHPDVAFINATGSGIIHGEDISLKPLREIFLEGVK